MGTLADGTIVCEQGVNVAVSKLDDLINWGRSNSVWSFLLGTSCCAIEFMALGAARYDMARFGFEVTRNSPVRVTCCSSWEPSPTAAHR